ncbi:MAG: NADH-quinone oxidoreductase subunit NuoE, partial [Syntrophorhabdaceae bacterium]|nr:NADH-quinone oxidoreductase subunit NuoE [Syntrophorhabdaceae bacterium]
LSKVDRIIDSHEKKEASLIPILQEVQGEFGYLPEEALVRIGEGLRIPLSKIYGVVTFYAQFYLTRRGRHTIKSCQGTACHVKGAKIVLDAIIKNLEINPGETTEDLNFSLETVACLGTCFLAPVIMIDHDYYGKLTPGSATKVLKKYYAKEIVEGD